MGMCFGQQGRDPCMVEDAGGEASSWDVCRRDQSPKESSLYNTEAPGDHEACESIVASKCGSGIFSSSPRCYTVF